MFVPLTAADFIDRAVQVYGERVGVVDEPDQPASPLGDEKGRLTYAEMGSLARRQAAKLDELGIGVGDRVAIVSHNSARLLTSFFGVAGTGRVLVPVNFRLRPEEVKYIVEHSGARVLLLDPELDDALRDVTAEHRFVIGDDEDLYAAEGVEPKPWEPDEGATACINYTSGTTARPKGVQITHRNIWVNAVTFALHAGVTDRDVYLHTLPMFHANGWGMPFGMTGLGVKQVVLRKVDGAEILRRVARPRRHRDVRGPGGRRGRARGGADVGGRDPRPRPGAHHHGRRPAADEDGGPGRGGARLGVHPDLRSHRDLAAADRQPHPRGVGRPLGRGTCGQAHARGGSRSRRPPGDLRAGRRRRR